ncbi:MAG: HD domain-containing protein [Mycoplasmoidaceae bacterium]
MEFNNFFKDPIYGEISFDNNQLFFELISSKEFIRLKEIKQLGICEKIFYTATHNRYSHSLGVYHLSKLFIKNLGIDIKSKNAEITMVAALLHDIGHGPFSHVFEKISNVNHETMTIKIINSPQTQINRILKKYNIDVDKVCNIYKYISDEPWMWQIISSTVDVDRMDYILRDSYTIGTHYGTIDIPLLISRTRLNDKKYIIHSYRSKNMIQAFLKARIFMKEDVYENNNVILYEWVLINIFEEIKKSRKKILEENINILNWNNFEFLFHPQKKFDFHNIESVNNYLNLTDNLLIDFIKSAASNNISIELNSLTHSFLTGCGLIWKEVNNFQKDNNYGVKFKKLSYDLLINKKNKNRFEYDILLFNLGMEPINYIWFGDIVKEKNDSMKIIKLMNTNFMKE